MESEEFTLGARRAILLGVFLFISQLTFSQEANPQSNGTRIQGYFAIFHPVNGYNTPRNFEDAYIVGFPIGVTFFKNAKVGYSLELFPFIQADSTGSKMSKIVFHPGVVFLLKHGFAFTARAAFESTGRYGVTQVLTKAIIRTKTGAVGRHLSLQKGLATEYQRRSHME